MLYSIAEMVDVNSDEDAQEDYEKRIEEEIKKNKDVSRMQNYVYGELSDDERDSSPTLDTSKMSLNVGYKTKKKIYDYQDMIKDISNKSSTNKPGLLVKIKRFLTDKPRNVIAKVAARLRETYRVWLLRANKENDLGKLNGIKNVLRILVKCIDFVMKKLEGLRVNYIERDMENKKLDKNSTDDIFRYNMGINRIKPIKPKQDKK